MKTRMSNLALGTKLRRGAGRILPASLLVSGLVFQTGAGHAAPDGVEVLRQMAAAESKIEYAATQTTIVGSKREVARIWRDGRKRRLEWLEPAVRKGDVLVDNGQKVWLYLKKDNTVVETNSAPQANRVSNSATVAGQEKIAGRNAFKVKSGERTIWVDAANKARLRLQSTWGSSGLQNVRFGPVEASRFTFQTPAGAETQKLDGTLYSNLTAARRAAPWLKAPSTLPTGYSLESAIVSDDNVWLRYADGGGRFSLFVQKGEAGELPPTEAEGGWFWKSGGLRYFATGAPAGSVPGLASSLK